MMNGKTTTPKGSPTQQADVPYTSTMEELATALSKTSLLCKNSFLNSEETEIDTIDHNHVNCYSTSCIQNARSVMDSSQYECLQQAIDGLSDPSIAFEEYQNELQMPYIMKLIQKDLSEPYSIYTYRYFIHNWPRLCFLVSIILNLIRLLYYKKHDYCSE